MLLLNFEGVRWLVDRNGRVAIAMLRMLRTRAVNHMLGDSSSDACVVVFFLSDR